MAVNKRKRILFIVQHRWNRSPGQRYRCEQYIPYLEKAGFDCVYSPILVTEQEDKDFYSPGNYFRKFVLFLKGLWRRWNDAMRAKNFDIIFIYREAFMTGTIVFEKMMKRSGAKIVYDFDDAIWNHDVSQANKALGWLKRPQKTNDIIALSDRVIVGNRYLAKHARQFNNDVVIAPSTIDLEYYNVPPKKPSNKIVIGWSGSLTTIEHFKPSIPVLKKVKERFGNKVEFRVFGANDYVNEELGIKGIAWTPENEVQQIAAFDIGIMYLPDNEWTRGKCGMKGLQYMALEVATIMSAVGVNNEIVEDGVNGFLAATEEEWVHKLCLLVESEELRKQLGKAGRKTVEEKYSCQALQQTYVNYFQTLIAQP
ncbi:MAG: glycosyltransferase family 4 protein [Chitinophagales bacterium]|nr:glycosyltransferase family 4 protein [Chitinophagales bacterium]